MVLKLHVACFLLHIMYYLSSLSGQCPRLQPFRFYGDRQVVSDADAAHFAVSFFFETRFYLPAREGEFSYSHQRSLLLSLSAVSITSLTATSSFKKPIQTGVSSVVVST